MEASFSSFPIVLEDEPGRGRHQNGSSTFVRAHVMERYHQQRRKVLASKSDKFMSTFQSSNNLMDEERRQKGTQLMGVKAQSKQSSSVVTVSGAFIQYETPTCAVRKGIESRQDLASTNHLDRRVTRKKSTSKEEPRSPVIRRLQLRDPREIDSSKFFEIFTAYTSLLGVRQTPLDLVSKSWLPAAFTDLALFHAMIFNFSQHLYALCSVDHEEPSLLKDKVDAIHHISARMENPVDACTDPVIASILCLISHEFLKEDKLALQAHLKGLRQIIAVRGGVGVLGLDGTLQTMYLGYELLFATVFKSWATKVSPLSFLSQISHSYPKRINILTMTQETVDSVTSDFSDATIHLLSVLESVFAGPESMKDSTVQTREHDYFLSLGDAETIDHTFLSLRLAISLQLANTDRDGIEIGKLVSQLKFHLNETSIRTFWNPYPGALLFCLVVAVSHSKNSPERPWFLANLIRVTAWLAFDNWDGLFDALQRFSAMG